MIASGKTNDLVDQPRSTIRYTRAALVIAHPGHELLVHGWLELVRPFVFVLTDGSGRTNQSRLDSTSKTLNQTGAKPGRIYGRLTDRAAYAAILDHEFDLFIRLAKELAEALIAERVEYVAGDAAEGYNPTHDVCRLVINAAVELANQRAVSTVANFEFPLIGEVRLNPGQALHAYDLRIQLGEEAFARKMAATRGYDALKGEVSEALGRTPIDTFRIECMRPVNNCRSNCSWDGDQPFYEEYGEKQIAAGYYHKVIRYAEHIVPLAEALSRYVKQENG